MTKKELKKALLMKRDEVRTARELRKKSIQDAIALEKGSSQEKREYHTLWKGGVFEVGVAKPGAEAIRKEGIVNQNDMLPFIKKSRKLKPESASFRDVFRDLEQAGNKSLRALELLGCLFVRSAYMLDHEAKNNKVIYSPPNNVVEEIKKDVTHLFGVPLEVFLQYAEAIALNEDVKYHTRGLNRGNAYGTGAGRQNNLLTCAHLIAVLLHRESLVDFAYGFSMMRGVSPINNKQSRIYFPLLGENGLVENKTSDEAAEEKKSKRRRR